MTAPNVPQVDAKDRRYQDIQSLQQLNEATTNPNLHYRWVLDHPLKIARHKMKGYEAVHPDSGVKTLADFTENKGDGFIRLGDTILMACDKGEFLARKKGQRKLANQRLSAPAKQFRKQAKRARAKVIQDEDEE